MGRRCKTCGVSIDHKKKNAIYCSAICKTNYWPYGENYDKVKNAKDEEMRKSDFLVSRSPQETKKRTNIPLKGVIEDRPKIQNQVPAQITNPEHTKLKDIKFNIELLLNRNNYVSNKLKSN